MDEILKNINTTKSVLGSFICDGKGKILAAAMPDVMDQSTLDIVGRTIAQTFNGLATIHRRKIADIDLVYGQGRFITKNLGESRLCILCMRNINVPLLDLSINAAAKKLVAMQVDKKKAGIQETKNREAMDSLSYRTSSEARSIISTARLRGVILQAAGDTAIRLHCPSAAHPETLLSGEALYLVGREKQASQIIQVLGDLGYTRERSFNVLRGSHRLKFSHPQKQFNLEVFLDVLKTHCQLDFSESLNQYDDTLPLADLLLWKLQDTPFDEQTARSIYAIVNDHELGGPGESEKIDASRVISVCAGDWGWYKAVTVDLEKSIEWVEKEWGEAAAIFLERARCLHQMIKDAPKSGEWQLRGLFDEEPHL